MSPSGGFLASEQLGKYACRGTSERSYSRGLGEGSVLGRPLGQTEACTARFLRLSCGFAGLGTGALQICFIRSVPCHHHRPSMGPVDRTLKGARSDCVLRLPTAVAARREERASTKKWEVSAFPLMVLWYVCVQGSLKSIQSKRIHRGKCGNLVRLSYFYFCMWLCVFQLYVWFWESSSLLILIVVIWLQEEPFLHGRNSPSFQDMLFVLSGTSVHRR